MSSFTEVFKDTRGQATIEAAYLIPVTFLLLLLMIQPGILLYNHMVMRGAASEGCRLLATKTEMAGGGSDKYEAYVLRRLGSIPPQDNFHIHEGGCSWEIELVGDETSEHVHVLIKNKVKFLPLFDTAGTLLGITDATGIYSQEVIETMPTHPSWVSESEYGLHPRAWVEKWRD